MTKPKKIQPKKSRADKTPESDKQSYTAIGVVFLVMGIAMMASEATRTVGIPFLTLGVTFFILGQKDA